MRRIAITGCPARRQRHVVHVEIAAVISAAGNKNKITWDRGADGQAPKLSDLGIQNEIAQTTE